MGILNLKKINFTAIRLLTLYTVENTVISPNFLVWKFCGKAQFSHSFGRIPKLFGNYAFPQNFHTRTSSEITVFFAALKDVDIEKVLICNKISFSEKNYKYLIGYLYNGNEVKPLRIMLPQTSAYVKGYDGQTKWMYFLIEDDDLKK